MKLFIFLFLAINLFVFFKSGYVHIYAYINKKIHPFLDKSYSSLNSLFENNLSLTNLDALEFSKYNG